jgi:hypothetical protein
MCGMKMGWDWDQRLDAISPLAGSLIAFISLLTVLELFTG